MSVNCLTQLARHAAANLLELRKEYGLNYLKVCSGTEVEFIAGKFQNCFKKRTF